MESMSFKALRVVSDTDVELIFEGDDGTQVVHTFNMLPVPQLGQGGAVVNGDDDFQQKYRNLISPDTPRWPETLAAEAWRAASQPFPAGQTLERLTEEVRAARKAAWDARH
ncbi:hypothetical protein [Catellatospora sichuanensis]|uniref:hypothetical protein n=1 Tax=Catellatospora sichuanensis TaxID=1969805 RepID=UPI00118381EF|nr:hypothetical protein [Catellatospora sichuanensis]